MLDSLLPHKHIINYTMKLINKISGLKLVALLVAITASFAAAAENKIYVEPFSITDYEPVEVPVYMDNDVDVYGVQFRFDLPDELEIVGTPQMNPVRTSNGQELTFKGVAAIITSWESKPIAENSGALMTVKLRIKDGMLSNNKVEFGLSRIGISGKDNKLVNLNDCTVDVTLGVEEEAPKYEFTTTASDVVVAPGQKFPIEVNMTNDAPLGGLEFLVKLPEGFDIAASDIKLSSRLTPGSRFRKTTRPDGTISLILLDMSTTKIAESGEGTLFTLNVSVPETFESTEGTVNLNDIIVSTVPDAAGMTKSINCGNLAVNIINGGKYLSDAQTVIAGLRTALAEALAEIAEKYPDVKDSFTGESITTAIDAIETAANTAFADATLPSKYDTIVTEPAAEVETSIKKLVEDAQAEQAELDRATANAKAYQETQAALEALMEQLGAAEAEAKEQYPDADVTEAVAAAQGAIEKATVDAEAAYNAVATEGTYNYTVDTEAIEALINAILPDAKAQQEEIERTVANAKAYQETQTAIQTLIEKLEGVEAQVKEQYPDADVTEPVAAAQQAIEKATLDAEEAYAAVATEGTYSFTVDTDAIDALIDAILPDAKAQQEEIERSSANAKAYQETQAALQTLMEQLELAQNEATEKYPDANTEATVAAAQAAIEKATVDAEAAYAAVATEGTYNYTVDTAAIEALINAILPDAKAQQEEIERTTANAKAYQETQAALQALMDQLEAVQNEAKQLYPEANVETTVAAAQAAIEKATVDAEAAYAAVATEGTYSFTVDTAAIEALINAILPDAKAQHDEAQRVAANEAAFKAVNEQIAALQAKLDAAKEEAAKYGDVDVTAEVNAAQAAISSAKTAAEAVYKAVAAAGNFSYEVPEAEINTLIDAIIAKAVADNEANRKEHNKAAYDQAIATLNALQAELDAAVEAAEKDCPHANITSVLNKAQTAITNARNDANLAYLAVDKEGVYNYTVDEAGIRALIEAITKSATEQEAAYQETQRVAANQAAYDKTVQDIAALQAKLDAAKAEVDEKYPDVDVEESVEAAQAAINKLTADAQAAFEAVTEEGIYSFTINTEAIDALIAAVVTDAEAQQAELDRTVANAQAYMETQTALQALIEKLEAAEAEVNELYPDADVTEAIAAANAAIEKATLEAEEAYAAVATEGTYEYTVDTDAIEALIAAVVTDAKAQQGEIERTTANAKAYMETQTAIQALIEKLEAAEAEAKELYPDADVTETVAAANAAIEKATLEAEEAYSAVATEGTYEYTVDTEAIEALIAEVVTDAKAQQDEHNRQAANKAAYDADIETIDGLQLKLDEMKTTVATLYDDVDVTEVVATAQQAIDAARQAADDALAAVAEEGEYTNVVPVEEIEGLIKNIETYAKENGIDSIEADAISSDVKIYTLSGTRVNRAIKGAVNILVKSDGTASKVYVK